MTVKKTFHGVPLWLCVLAALLLSVVWWWVWPKKLAEAASGPRVFVLRWFHSLTWALLALAALCGMADQAWSPALGRALALASLAFYLTFLATALGLFR